MNDLKEIIAALQSAGNITETARLEGRPISAIERTFVSNVRKNARQRLSQQMINTIENEGANTVRKALS